MSEEEFGDFDHEPEEVKPEFVTTANKFIRHKKSEPEKEVKQEFVTTANKFIRHKKSEPEEDELEEKLEKELEDELKEEVKPKFVVTAKKFIRNRDSASSKEPEEDEPEEDEPEEDESEEDESEEDEPEEDEPEEDESKNGSYFTDIDINRDVHPIKDYNQFIRDKLLKPYVDRRESLEKKEKSLKEQKRELSKEDKQNLNFTRKREERMRKIIDVNDVGLITILLHDRGIEVSRDHKTWRCTLREVYDMAERMRVDDIERKEQKRIITTEKLEKYRKKYVDVELSTEDIKNKLAKIKTLQIVTTEQVSMAAMILQTLKVLGKMYDKQLGTYMVGIYQEEWKRQVYIRLFRGIEIFIPSLSPIGKKGYFKEIEIIQKFATSLDLQISEDTILFILQMFNIDKKVGYKKFFNEVAYIIGVIINLPNLTKLSEAITLNDFNKCLNQIDLTTFYLSADIEARLIHLVVSKKVLDYVNE